MEGAEYQVNRKYLPSVNINTDRTNVKKAVALSNNAPPESGALVRRLTSFFFAPVIRNFTAMQKKRFADKLLSEAVSFSIFCNIIYLRNKGYNPSVPLSWKGKDCNEYIKTGFF